MANWLRQLGFAALLLLAGCGDRHAGGNSAETGNPEIAGILVLPSGLAANAARVQCVPRGFNPIEDTLAPKWETLTDSLGAFVLDSLDTTRCNLLAYHAESQTMLYLQDLDLHAKSTLQVRGSLGLTGAVRVGIEDMDDGDSGWAYVPGTTLAQRTFVRFQSIFLDMLPAAQLDSILLVPDMGSPTLLSEGLQIKPGDTSLVSTTPIHFETTLSLNDAFAAQGNLDTLVGFPWSLTLDSSDIDFASIQPDKGRLSFVRNGKELGFQKVVWDSKSKKAVFWVRLDTLFPSSASQFLKFVFDDSTNTPLAWLPAPFGAQDSMTAAWHFETSGSTTLDAGPNHLDGFAWNTKVEKGCVGNAYWYDGRTSYVSIPGSESGPLNFAYDAEATFALWVRLDAPNTSRFVFGKGLSQLHLKYQFPSEWLFENNDNQATTNYHRYQAPFDTINDKGTWMHLAVVNTAAGSSRLYVNGSLVDSMGNYNANPISRTEAHTFDIGRQVRADFSTGQFFWGLIDEFHVWHDAKSDGWIKALYLNQKANP